MVNKLTITLFLCVFSYSTNTLAQYNDILRSGVKLVLSDSTIFNTYKISNKIIEANCEEFVVVEIPFVTEKDTCQSIEKLSQCVVGLCEKHIFFAMPECYFRIIEFKKEKSNRFKLVLKIEYAENMDNVAEIYFSSKFKIDQGKSIHLIKLIREIHRFKVKRKRYRIDKTDLLKN